MSFRLELTASAKKDIEYFKKAGNKPVLKKLFTLLNEVSEHPKEGTGKPEQLKYSLSGTWSRRINREHRLIYEIFTDHVVIHSARGHY